jgi:hypothetical protein
MLSSQYAIGVLVALNYSHRISMDVVIEFPMCCRYMHGVLKTARL